MTPDPIPLVAGLNQNFELFCAEDKVISIEMTGYDLSTVTSLDWWMSTSPYAVESLLAKTKDAGITVNGTKAVITLTSADTKNIKPELYYHELRVVQADGSRKVALTGNIVLRMSLNAPVLV
jgi:hypothetical protein